MGRGRDIYLAAPYFLKLPMRSFHSLLSLFSLAATIGAFAADPAPKLIQNGDACDTHLDAVGALNYYLSAEKLTPSDARLCTRISRQYRHLMSDTGKSTEKVRLGKIATGYADRAASLAPNDPEAQLAVAISYGKLLPLQSSREQVENSKVVKTATDKVLQLDPSNDLGWQILGRWYFNLADVSSVKRALAQLVYGKLPEATFADAERCFLKAIELNPRRLIHYIQLGRTYVKMGRTEDARKYLTQGLAMASVEKDDPESKELGRELLGKLPGGK